MTFAFLNRLEALDAFAEKHLDLAQKSPLLSHRSVDRRTKLRRSRSYVHGSIFLLAFCNHHCDRIIVALILIVLLHSRSSQYQHVRSLCLIISITVTSTPSVNLKVVLTFSINFVQRVGILLETLEYVYIIHM